MTAKCTVQLVLHCVLMGRTQLSTSLTRQAVYNMDIVDGNIIRSTDGKVLMSLKELAMTAQYNAAKSERITAESTFTIRKNAYNLSQQHNAVCVT